MHRFYRVGMRAFLVSIVTICGVAGQAMSAEGVAAFFEGRTVNIIVGTSPGGGYDTFARLVAPKLASALKANVVVQNRPGAGGLLVLNQAATDKADGLTLTLANVSAAMSATLVPSEAARFDIRKFGWLGGILSDPRALVVPATASLDNWQSRPQSPALIRWSALGRSDNLAISAALVSEALGLKSKIVSGYGGSSEAIAALIRGEADATIVSLESAQKAAGPETVRVAAIMTSKRFEGANEIPTIYELAGPNADRVWLDFVINLTTLGRAFIVAPGTPKERVDFLTEKLEAIITDPEFIKSASALGRSLDYASPASLTSAIESALSHTDPVFLTKLTDVLGSKYF